MKKTGVLYWNRVEYRSESIAGCITLDIPYKIIDPDDSFTSYLPLMEKSIIEKLSSLGCPSLDHSFYNIAFSQSYPNTLSIRFYVWANHDEQITKWFADHFHE
jgi:hypothetical protein